LPGEHVAVVEQHLEVNMGGAAGVPARIDRLEADRAFAVGELRAAEEFLPDGREVLLVALALVARIDTLRIGMPDVDAGALARLASGAVDDTQIDPQRDARPALGDLRANEPGIEIKRTLDRLRRQETHVRIRERRRVGR